MPLSGVTYWMMFFILPFPPLPSLPLRCAPHLSLMDNTGVLRLWCTRPPVGKPHEGRPLFKGTPNRSLDHFRSNTTFPTGHRHVVRALAAIPLDSPFSPSSTSRRTSGSGAEALFLGHLQSGALLRNAMLVHLFAFFSLAGTFSPLPIATPPCNVRPCHPACGLMDRKGSRRTAELCVCSLPTPPSPHPRGITPSRSN